MSELLDYLRTQEPDFKRNRLTALYSDFRSQRSLNPDGFVANVSAWKRGLSNAALAGHAPSKSPARSHVVLELDDALLRSLDSPELGRPLALGSVLQEALASGEMIPLPQFQKATQSIYHKSWGSIPWAVAGWAFRQIGISGGPGDKMPKGQIVVVVRNLEAVAKTFADATVDRQSPFERTFSPTHFRRTFESNLLKGQRLSEQDFDVFIKFLSRDKDMLATNGNTIKIKNPSEPNTITEEDSAIASLKELTEDLTRQTEALSRRIDELNRAAQDAVLKKNRVSALAALRSRKLAENNLATRHATLNQLEEVATKIQQAADNVQLVRVMQSSTGALRSLNAQVGGADKVDAILDDLREQMGEVDEVGNVIAEAGQVGVVDEAEVDDELEAMLAEERKKEEESERVKKEAREMEEAEETRRKLAELEKLAPVPVPETETEKRAVTPVTAAADELGGLHLDTSGKETEKEREQIPAE
ncbi:Snf7-domain-containing protein [Xylariaceae sp. FL1019]|nr:Snf7-domain-containing protein [Xylariaceae sp. FL1019]